MRRLIMRRHRHSPEVAGVVGADWAERAEPRHLLVPASPRRTPWPTSSRDVWLHPKAVEPTLGRQLPLPVDAGQGLPLLAGRPRRVVPSALARKLEP